ncbi:MAG: Rpn family recombination-promoting nuclease/putative transposase [Lachnospiraceae bacterium]|nr:Rpn family recombination-promoting nuclease/putative transposase [Lachnospiraceae bacterium]
MFAAVMLDEENAKGVVERALGIHVDHVEVSYEKSIVYNPEYKGIRLDVYLKDDKNRHFNVEMQVANTEIFRRSRYYHSQIDMELLSTGFDYEQLPESYVIFICDFDPIGLGKYKYTRRQVIEEDLEYNFDDGSYTVFLSTVGTNEDEVSQDLVKFLKYVGAEIEESNEDYSDEFVKRLQKSVEKIKFDRELGRRYMLFEELMKEEYNAGKAETIGNARDILIDLLCEIAPISDCLKRRISSIKEIEAIMQLTVKAAQADSLEAFEEELSKMGF